MLLALLPQVSSCFECGDVADWPKVPALVRISKDDLPNRSSAEVFLVMPGRKSLEAGDIDDPSSNNKDEDTGSELSRSWESKIGTS
jgi:hypothetical protein